MTPLFVLLTAPATCLAVTVGLMTGAGYSLGVDGYHAVKVGVAKVWHKVWHKVHKPKPVEEFKSCHCEAGIHE